MKTTIVRAYKKVKNANGAEEKVFAGERSVSEPETVAEAIALEETEEKGKGEANVLARYWDSKVIAIQSQIRREGEEGERAKMKRLRKFAAENPDSEVAKTLTSIGISF